LLKTVDRHARQRKKSRPAFIETAIWTFIGQAPRDEQNARDLEILDRRAGTLTREATDVLSHQVQL